MFLRRADSKQNDELKIDRLAAILRPAVLMMEDAAGSCDGARMLDLDPAKGERLKASDKSFDLVTSRWSLPRYSNVDGILREVSRVLAPGGRFAVVLPGREE